jgi:hypothetical protein
MMALMPLFESEPSSGPPATDARGSPRRPPRGFLLYSAIPALAIGVFIQVWTARVVITCQRDAGAAPSCNLERRVLFNTLAIGRERVTGVKGARTSVRTGARRRAETATFVVVLDTAEGERDAGWSSQGEPANALALAINERIRTGAASFEETARPHVFDEMVRLFGLFWIVVGAGLVLLSVRRWRGAAEPGL